MSNPFIAPKGQPIVYVRPVAPEELPVELRGTTETVFAIHDESGQRLALARDRKLAFVLARQNEMTPLSVH